MTAEDLAVQDAGASKRPAVVGEGGAPEKPTRTNIRVHDFRLPKTLDRNRLRGLQVLYETLAHRAERLADQPPAHAGDADVGGVRAALVGRLCQHAARADLPVRGHAGPAPGSGGAARAAAAWP